MTVKDLQEQLKLAKNKDAEVLFRLGNNNLKLELMTEVVSDKKDVHFPVLGETANAVAIKLSTEVEQTGYSSGEIE